MLPSQQPKLLDHTHLLKIVLVAVSCVHIIGCYVFLFTYTQYRPKTSIYGSAKNRAAVVKIVSSRVTGHTVQRSKQTGAKNRQKNGAAKQQKKVAEKAVKKASTAVVKKAGRGKPQSAKASKEQKKKQPAAAPVNVPKVVPEKVSEKIKEEPKKESSVADETVSTATAVDTDDVVYATPQEYHALMIEQALCQAMEAVWTPPAGMDRSLATEVAITVDWQGNIIETKVEQRSGVLVYDVAVEQAVAQFCPPREAWGKTVHLVFKP